MIHIQEPKSPWEVVHMDWVKALPPSGDKSYNACLVIVDRHQCECHVNRWRLTSHCTAIPQDETMMLPPHLRPHHSLCFRTPALSSLPLTILTLPRCPQDLPLRLRLTPLMPNPLSATYHPYAQVLDP
ncbi:hypothetical protein O181_013257 [Austropuccinia psidii MF-1]|uniref:Uncharacterized protein n=1 Tax=Austropuccinia psidii MF-1 TaxID=1389203 RepID=A0A9Q3BXY9_9BASI|nr:hypothetical protein [Austropuccinia psidii MF-1]